MNAEALIAVAVLPLAGQQAAIERYPDALSTNEHITDEMWMSLWGKKRTAERAINLVSRTLPEHLRHHAIRTDDRAKVIKALLEHNTLDESDWEHYRAHPKLSAGALTDLLGHVGPGPAGRDLASRAPAVPALRWVGTQPEESLSDEDLIEMVELFPIVHPIEVDSQADRRLWGPAKQLAVARPVALRPMLTHGQPKAMATTAAGCPNLSTQDLQDLVLEGRIDHIGANLMTISALVGNPSVTEATLLTVRAAAEAQARAHTDRDQSHKIGEIATTITRRLSGAGLPLAVGALHTVDDPDVIDKLVFKWRGGVTSWGDEIKPKPWWMYLLVGNPHLTDAQVLTVATTISSLPETFRAPAVEQLAARHPNPDAVYSHGAGFTYQTGTNDPIDWAYVAGREAVVGGQKLSRFGGSSADDNRAIANLAAEQFGENQDAWQALYALLDSGFGGTVNELIETASAVS